jgi:polygalacturonase
MKNTKNILMIGLLISAWLPIVHATIPLPDIPATQFLITDYGADTTSIDNSTAINAAIAAANNAGGDTVVIPAGRFLSGPITMQSNVNLYISAGAILQLMPYGNGSPAGSYPNDGTIDSYAYFIYGVGLNNIEVSGTGVIEGDGAAW